MKCSGCNQERDKSGNCTCVKCHTFWVPHRLPRIHWSEGKIVKGQQYEVLPPLLDALLTLRPRDVMIEPGRVMLCLDMCRNWQRMLPRVEEIFANRKLLQFNGAISPTRKPHCKVLWVNHHQPNRKRAWRDCDLDHFLTLTFMPRLVRLLLECHNVGRLYFFDEGFPGVTVMQKFTEPWDKTVAEILAVLKDGFVERFINPPEPGSCFDVPQHLWNAAWKWNPTHADAHDAAGERRLPG